MTESIRVLIVDDLSETRENVRKLLQFESDVEVIGQAGTGEQAIEMAQKHTPDIILMDINMPGIDGIGASQKISELVPRTQVIIMSVQSESDYMQRAMLAGARYFLTKPFGGDELITAIRRVYDKRPSTVPMVAVPARRTAVGPPTDLPTFTEGRILTVFSPKGGSGCTTVAINLAVTLAKRGHRTLLIDGSFQFGDVAVMLNMKPVSSVVDIAERINELDAEYINSVVQVHKDSGLDVLLAPPRTEMADVVKEEHVKKLLEMLRPIYEFVVIDTGSYLNDVTLALLDGADRIVLLTQQTLPSLKNISRFYDLTKGLKYPPEKVWLVVNRASPKYSVSVQDIGKALKQPISIIVPTEETAVNAAADQGKPIILQQSRKHPLSMAFNKLADQIIEELITAKTAAKATPNANKGSGIFGRLFGKRVSAGG